MRILCDNILFRFDVSGYVLRMRIRHWRSQLRHRPTAPKYSIVREDPTMEAGEAGGEDSRDLLLFRSDFSGFEQLEPRDG